MQWAVRRLDADLDSAENDPPPAAKALINAARGPAGAATVKGATTAARLTVQLGTEALKVRRDLANHRPLLAMYDPA